MTDRDKLYLSKSGNLFIYEPDGSSTPYLRETPARAAAEEILAALKRIVDAEFWAPGAVKRIAQEAIKKAGG